MKSAAGTIDKQIGKNIKAARDAAVVGSRELSRALKLSEVSIYKYEAGIVRIPASAIVAIAYALDISPAVLFDGIARNDIAAFCGRFTFKKLNYLRRRAQRMEKLRKV